MPTDWAEFTPEAKQTDWSEFSPEEPAAPATVDVSPIRDLPNLPATPQFNVIPNPTEGFTGYKQPGIAEAYRLGSEMKQAAAEPLAPLPTAPSIEEKPVQPWEHYMLKLPGARDLRAVLGEDVTAQVIREIYNQGKALPEFAESPMGVGTIIAGVGAPKVVAGAFGVDTAISLVKQGISTIRDWDTMTAPQKARSLVQLVGMGTLGVLLGKTALSKPVPPVIKETIAQHETLMPQSAAAAKEATKGEITDASEISKAAEVYGDVRTQPVEGVGQVPVEESRAGVQPQAEGRLPETVQAPSPEDRQAGILLTEKSTPPPESTPTVSQAAEPSRPTIAIRPDVIKPLVRYGQEYPDTPTMAVRNGMKLSEVIDAPELFAAHPELADYTIRTRKYSEGYSGARPKEKTIYLVTDTTGERQARYLFHEITHAIQEAEGRPSGKRYFEKGYREDPSEVEARASSTAAKAAWDEAANRFRQPAPQAEPTPTAIPPAEPSSQTLAKQGISQATTPEQVSQAQGPGMVGMGGAAAGELGTGAGADIYGVAQRVREQRARAGQVGPVESGKGIAAPDSVERGRALIDQGANAEQTLVAFEKTQKISSDDMAIVRAHGELLAFEARRLEEKFGTDSPQYREAKQRLTAWDTRTKPMQTEWHKIGMAQQGETDIDTGTFTGLERAYRQDTGKDFTPDQGKKAKKIAADVTTATKDAVAKEQKIAFVLQQRGGKTPEQRALDAANKAVRDWAAKRAELEAKSLAEQEKLKTQMEQVSRKATEDAEKATTEQRRLATIRAAEAERAKLANAGVKAKAKSDAEIKATQRALDAAAKTVRNAAARAAEAERKAAADPIGTVWKKAKEYVDQGITNFDEVRNKVATDLGMKVEQVTRYMARDRTVKQAADDFWISQQRARRLHGQAKRWVKAQENPLYERALAGVPRILFSIRVGFHGTVALGTHAPAVAFEPHFWSIYARDFGKMYRMVNPKGGRVYYENQVQDLLRRDNYITAKRAGLVNDPFTYEDFNSPQTSKFFGDLSGMGNRGYTILKILRQDMFDQMWGNLPKAKQIPEVAQAIANSVNHATGVVKTSAPMGANVALFAPRLEASRVMWLAGDPVRAARTFMDWKNASVGEKEFAINQAKEKAWVMGTMASMLALNQGVLKAIGSNQNVNVTDPTKSDFLKFKVAGMNVSYGNAMITMARLPIRLWVGIRNESKLSKIIHEDENTAKTLFDYARSQASPFASLMMDLAFGRDYTERPLPRAGFGALPQRPISKRLKAQGVKPYTWTEFWTQQSLPIPFQEAVREVWKAMGMKQADMAHWMKAWAVLTFMSGTGGRISEDYNAPAF